MGEFPLSVSLKDFVDFSDLIVFIDLKDLRVLLDIWVYFANTSFLEDFLLSTDRGPLN